jgi:uncharacterized protein (DUF1697 family)
MPRYVAFLRGVSPLNANMGSLRKAFESAGFTNVATVLSSGNVVFNATASEEPSLESRAEAAMAQALPRQFLTFVRSTEYLRALLARDPFLACGIPREAKRVITFMRVSRQPAVTLPHSRDLASLFLAEGREAFAAYIRIPGQPVFMSLIEEAFGKDVTTRTWDTVAKCIKA